MQSLGQNPQPLVVYVSEDRTGVTFALDPQARRTLQTRFGVHPSPRIFIGHDTRQAFEEMHGPMLRQLLLLLTGVSEERLREMGAVEFREAATERVLRGLTA